MKWICFFALLILLASCMGTKNAASADNRFNGTWVPVKQEMGGKLLPGEAYKGQSLVINDSTYEFTAESVDKGTVKRNGNKMDIYGKEGVNAGRHIMAIYKLEKGLLWICYNLKGDGYPDDYDTHGKPLYFLSVFTKILIR